MAVNVPKPPPCEECGGDAVFHQFTYSSILVDELFAFPQIRFPGSRVFANIGNAVERRLTPLIFRALTRLGVAERVMEPDEHTQLLALMLWNEAKTRGIEVSEIRLFGLPRNIFLARLPNGRTICYEGIPMPPRDIDRVEWMDNKAVLKDKFRKLGFPIAKGGTADSLKAALRIYKNVTPPVIAKPFSGSGSRHTILHIKDEAELARGFSIAKQIAPRVVIEEELVGPVYRATTVDGKFAAALRRDQPHVIGDGVHTVTELAAEENKNPQRQGPYFHHVNLDDAAKKELAWQGFDFNTVLKNGQWANLHPKINWSVGGTTADVTDEVHPDNVALFEEVTKVLKAPIAGIDFIIADISRSWKEQDRCGILECNSMPFFDNHHLPFEGRPRNVASLIWQMNGV
ncbi:MAG: Cyanophycin synthetase [Parcubacteria group bacterium]|nr:Cyanophycin synthetase [Parcubacteria group bacterium]